MITSEHGGTCLDPDSSTKRAAAIWEQVALTTVAADEHCFWSGKCYWGEAMAQATDVTLLEKMFKG